LQVPEVAAFPPQPLELVRQLSQPPEIAKLQRGQFDAVQGTPDDGRIAGFTGEPERALPELEPAIELQQMR